MLRGYRERIKKAGTLEEAQNLLLNAIANASEKSIRRCKQAFSQLSFNKKQDK